MLVLVLGLKSDFGHSRAVLFSIVIISCQFSKVKNSMQVANTVIVIVTVILIVIVIVIVIVIIDIFPLLIVLF